MMETVKTVSIVLAGIAGALFLVDRFKPAK